MSDSNTGRTGPAARSAEAEAEPEPEPQFRYGGAVHKSKYPFIASSSILSDSNAGGTGPAARSAEPEPEPHFRYGGAAHKSKRYMVTSVLMGLTILQAGLDLLHAAQSQNQSQFAIRNVSSRFSPELFLDHHVGWFRSPFVARRPPY